MSGSFSDPGTADWHTVVIDWGDEQSDTLTLAAGVLSIPSTPHTYDQNQPGNLPYLVSVTITDKDAESTTAETEVEVDLVPPTITLSGANAVGIDSDYTLTVNVQNPDEAIIVIHWGDGQSETFDVADLAPSSELTHQYADGPGSRDISVDMYDENVTYACTATLVGLDVTPFPDAIDDIYVSNRRADCFLAANFGNLAQLGDFYVTQPTALLDGYAWADTYNRGLVEWLPANDCLSGNYTLDASFTYNETTWSKRFTLHVFNEDLPPAFPLEGYDSVWTGHDIMLTNDPNLSGLTYQFAAYGGTGALSYDFAPGSSLPENFDLEADGSFTWNYLPADNGQVYDFDVEVSDSATPSPRHDRVHVVFPVQAYYTTPAAYLENQYDRIEVDSVSQPIPLIGGNYGVYLLGDNSELVFDGGVTEVSGVYRTAHGVLDLSTADENGYASYTPDEGFRGLDSFTYHWHYDYLVYGTAPEEFIPRDTNTARVEIQVGNWVDIQAVDAPVFDGNIVIGAGQETEATITLQNPRGDGAASTVNWSISFSRDQIRVFDTSGNEILPGQSMLEVVTGWDAYGNGEGTLTIDILPQPGSSGGLGNLTVTGSESAVRPFVDPENPPIGFPIISGTESLPFVAANADIDTDSNNKDGITEADDPATDSTFEEKAPGKLVRLNNDDDNGNGTPDKNDSGMTAGENDLVEAIIRSPGVLITQANQWSGTLTASAGIKVWLDSQRNQLLLNSSGSVTRDLYDISFPQSVYVEGIAAGTATLTWEVKSGQRTVSSDFVKFTVVGIDITGGGSPLPGTATNVMVGQHIVLDGVVSAGNAKVTNIQWTVPGNRIRNYTQSQDLDDSKGVVETLDAADLKADHVEYYWIDGGTNLNVNLSIVINGIHFSADTYFNVLRPTATMESRTTRNEHPIDIINNNYMGLGTPDATDTNGITWTAYVESPIGGSIAFTQLVNSDCIFTYPTGRSLELSTRGEFMLDTNTQYANEYLPIAANTGAILISTDSPGGPVGSGNHVSNTGYFETFLMYKPDGLDSIWVTLRQLHWWWSGDASPLSGTPAKWILDGSDYSHDPTSMDSILLPQWEHNVYHHIYTDIKL